jgi:hypothetical protein
MCSIYLFINFIYNKLRFLDEFHYLMLFTSILRQEAMLSQILFLGYVKSSSKVWILSFSFRMVIADDKYYDKTL